MLTALLAGVGVAGVSAASASASPAGDATDTAWKAQTRTLAAAPVIRERLLPRARPVPLPDVAVSVAPSAAPTTPAVLVPAVPKPSAPARSFARARQKARPKPPPPTWVNPMPEGRVTSCFGPRWGRLHAGVDLAAPLGTPIRTVGAGRVVHAGERGGYGLSVLVDHGNGYFTHYGHMSKLSVEAGTTVTAGQQVGEEGSTGHSTGPHLHFEVHKGVWKNTVEPIAWLREHGVAIPGCTVETKPKR